MTFISAFFPIFPPVFWPSALHRAAQLRSITTITTFYSSSSLEAELGAALTNAAPRLGSPFPTALNCGYILFLCSHVSVPVPNGTCVRDKLIMSQVNIKQADRQLGGGRVETQLWTLLLEDTLHALHTSGGRHSNILIAIFLARTSYKLSRKLHNIPTFTTRGYGDLCLLQIVKASKNKRILNIDKKHLSISHSSGSLITGDTSQQHYYTLTDM